MEKINVADLLMGCLPGMELDCTLFDDVVFEEVDFSFFKHPVIIRRTDTNTTIHLTKYGQYIAGEDCKCVIFPKGKTTWEGFFPPCKFKDGDIVITTLDHIAIIKEPSGKEYSTHVLKTGNVLITGVRACASRFATEEEKQKLFDAIKKSGYKWNEETKTLEKLIEPKFKVGNKIKEINSNEYVVLITDITDDYYIGETEYCMKVAISMNMQNNYELVPNKFDITTLKPFESRVLVRDFSYDVWKVSFWGRLINNGGAFIYDTTRGIYNQCIPYEGNEHLLGTTDDCSEFYKTWK